MGCSSSYMVSPSLSAEETFSTFNADAKDESATIVLQDGRRLYAQDVIAEPDSTSFMNVTTGRRTVVLTHEIQKIVLTSWSAGIRDGALYGFLGGVAAGLVGAAIAYPFLEDGREIPKEAIFLFLPAIGGGAGLLLGPIIGGISGHTYEYEFMNESKMP